MAIRNKEDLKATVAERVLTQQLLVDLIDSSTDTGVASDLASHEANTTDAHGINVHIDNTIDAHGIDLKLDTTTFTSHENNLTTAHGINSHYNNDIDAHGIDLHYGNTLDAHRIDLKLDSSDFYSHISDTTIAHGIGDKLSTSTFTSHENNTTNAHGLNNKLDASTFTTHESNTTTAHGLSNKLATSTFTTHESNTTTAHGIDGLMNKASSSDANKIVLFSDDTGKSVNASSIKCYPNGSINTSSTNVITTSDPLPSFALGNELQSSGEGNILIGRIITVIGSAQCISLGKQNIIDTCSTSYVIGWFNTFSNTLTSHCLGNGNSIDSCSDSLCIGSNNFLNADNCLAIGYGVVGSVENTVYIKNTNIKLEGNLSVSGFKSGASQVLAGASAGEIWRDTADNTLKVGV